MSACLGRRSGPHPGCMHMGFCGAQTLAAYIRRHVPAGGPNPGCMHVGSSGDQALAACMREPALCALGGPDPGCMHLRAGGPRSWLHAYARWGALTPAACICALGGPGPGCMHMGCCRGHVPQLTWPRFAARTLPMITSSTASIGMRARSTAATARMRGRGGYKGEG